MLITRVNSFISTWALARNLPGSKRRSAFQSQSIVPSSIYSLICKSCLMHAKLHKTVFVNKHEKSEISKVKRKSRKPHFRISFKISIYVDRFNLFQCKHHNEFVKILNKPSYGRRLTLVRNVQEQTLSNSHQIWIIMGIK